MLGNLDEVVTVCKSRGGGLLSSELPVLQEISGLFNYLTILREEGMCSM